MLTPHSSAVQYCPDCESTLSRPDGHKAVPWAFRLMLRITLPPPDDDHLIAASADQEETDQQKLVKQISEVHGRLEKLEGRFDLVANDTQTVKVEIQSLKDKMQSLEDKMECILSILSGLAASPLFATQIVASNPSKDIITSPSLPTED